MRDTECGQIRTHRVGTWGRQVIRTCPQTDAHGLGVAGYESTTSHPVSAGRRRHIDRSSGSRGIELALGVEELAVGNF